MEIRKAIHIVFVIIFMTMISSCSTDEYNFTEATNEEINITPGLYTTDIVLSAKESNNTRSINNGQFTNEYPYDYIYIHSADEPHQALKVNLKDVYYCNGCQGIHLEIEVNDDGETYTIYNGERGAEGTESITLNKKDSVYFSTIPTSTWKAEMATHQTPIETAISQDVFVDTDGINEELLRSQYFFDLQDLINLTLVDESTGTYPHIYMERHCTGFRAYFMFTDPDGEYTLSTTLWNLFFNKPYDNFYTKIYFGPNFCHEYDIRNNIVISEDNGGYYSSNAEEYKPFEKVSSGQTGDGTPEHPTMTYQGFGYMTEGGHYLLTPLNKNIHAEEFRFYVFIKYWDGDGEPDEEWLKSDEGAKWFEVKLENISLDPNMIHYIILTLSYKDLLKEFPESAKNTSSATSSSTLTRGWFENRAPQEIDIKPVDVKVITE